MSRALSLSTMPVPTPIYVVVVVVIDDDNCAWVCFPNRETQGIMGVQKRNL